MSDRPKPGPHPDEPDPVVIRDKRKIDRPPSDSGSPLPDDSIYEPLSTDAELLLERTADLQRLQAEYANYRKRAERDRMAAGDAAVSRVLTALLPVLDDIERARTHGDLTGGLKAIADQLEVIFTKLGLEAFGEVGDPFDPTVHEAVMHQEADEQAAGITVPTSTTVMRKGYRHGERLLRPAMVGVTDPAQAAEPAVEPDPASGGETPSGDEPPDTGTDE